MKTKNIIKCLQPLVLLIIVSVQKYEAKNCRYEVDCRADECCMTRSFMLGGCRPYGDIGSPCQPEARKSFMGDMYLKVCPCREGLKCKAEKEVIGEIIVYTNGTCQIDTSVAAAPVTDELTMTVTEDLSITVSSCGGTLAGVITR